MAEADLSCRGVGGVDLRPVGRAAAVRRGFKERDLRGVKPREQDEVRAAEAISCSLLSRGEGTRAAAVGGASAEMEHLVKKNMSSGPAVLMWGR